MSIADQMRAVLARSNELDAQLARRIGQHIDSQAARLQELELISAAKAKQNFNLLLVGARPGSQADLMNMTVQQLKKVAAQLKLPGRSKPKRKADLVAFLLEHHAPALPSYDQLLNFYLNHSISSQPG